MPSAPRGTTIRSEPVDTRFGSVDDTRPDQDRSRRLIAGILTAVLSRASGAIVPIALIPVTLGYLGADRYGLWTAVVALTGMVAFADLGLGNGLMTKLAPCYASGDVARARRYVSSAYLLLVTMALGACVLLWSLAGVIPWSRIFNVGGAATASDARTMSLLCLTVFIVNVPLSLVIRVQYAYQQVGASNVWQAAGNLSTLPLVLAAVHADLPPTVVVGASVLGPVLGNTGSSIWWYGRRMPEIRPHPRHIDRGLAGQLLRLSGMFFVLTIVMSVAHNTDMLIVAHVLDLRSVTAYAVPAKLFAQLGMLVFLVSVPLWPANGDALAQGRLDWVRRVTRRMTGISCLVALVPGAALVFGGERLLARWMDAPVGGDPVLLAGLAVWLVLLATISPRFMVQNAAGVVRPQLLGWVAYLALSVVTKWYGVRWWGIVAVPYAAIGSYLVTVLPSAIYGYRRALALHDPRRVKGGSSDVPARPIVSAGAGGG